MQKAVATLIKGGIIAYPTDTIYGLGCDAMNMDSVKRLFKIKKRSPLDPISISLPQISEISRFAHVNNKDFMNQLEKYDLLPGPVTLILKKRDHVPDILTAGKDTIGVRIPGHRVTRSLSEDLGGPITTTSANISSEEPASTYDDLSEEIVEKVDYVLEGNCKYKKPSTVLDLTGEEVEILREGAEEEKIRKIISGEIEEDEDEED
ncbi:MAG: L-threonylcarbamoyladenylate synthase [Candidatus Aenigmatarchaeota archaeon]